MSTFYPIVLWWIAWQQSFPWYFPHRTVNMCKSSILSTWRASGFLVAQWLSCYRVTLVVLTLLPVLQDQPVRSGKTLHSSPSIHGCIWHHHFWATMEASTQEGLALVVPATCPGKQEHLTVWERSSILFLLQQRWTATTSHVPCFTWYETVGPRWLRLPADTGSTQSITKATKKATCKGQADLLNSFILLVVFDLSSTD